MLKEGTIIPFQSPYASPIVLCRNNNGLPPDNPEAYRFAVDYRKLNAITKYPRYPFPLIDDLIMNISHTGIMSALNLRSGYFQIAVNPNDIVKTTFVMKNGIYAFRRMPFGLSGAGPTFQKEIDVILKPMIGKFVNAYMDDVIISSPPFTQHVEYLKEVFRLLYEVGLTLNKDKCKFSCEDLKYLGLIINKEEIKTDETKVQAIVEMKPPRNLKEVSNFLGMSQWTNYNLPKFRKKSRKEETVITTTSGYNLRPRNGKRLGSRPTIQRKTQQGGPVRSRKGRGRNDSQYIEERTRSSNRNAKRGGDQQRQDQERKGAWTRKSKSLEVLVGNANYKS
ncbi:retrovirus-related Pol polyprotein from transposon opus [Trichonephila clavipes]|nr:retrovirus-related Pol polyprotein from transposon opus [Trichonephila clavipes]